MQKFYWTNQSCGTNFKDPSRTGTGSEVGSWCGAQNVQSMHGVHPAQYGGQVTSVGRSPSTTPQLSSMWGEHESHNINQHRHSSRGKQNWNQRNKTWNQNTLRQAQCELERDLRREKRQSIQNIEFFKHNYENVYNKVGQDGFIETAVSEETKSHDSIRHTPRSCKNRKTPKPVFRSKSCDREGSLLDSYSILQAVAARAIPCVQPPCTASGRLSPTDSTAYQGTEPSKPAQNLADRMRGRLEYVNKKISMIRSRSAERLRGCTSAPRSEGKGEVWAPIEYSGPVLGQARAVVDCIPGPWERDALPFNKGDIIDIIAMNPGGLWRGRCGERVGNFKFVNVEILPAMGRRQSVRSVKRRPGNIKEVMKALEMEEHLPVFILNGYENLTLFKDLDEEELDYLGITDEKQRRKLLAMAKHLFPDGVRKSALSDEDDSESENKSSSS